MPQRGGKGRLHLLSQEARIRHVRPSGDAVVNMLPWASMGFHGLPQASMGFHGLPRLLWASTCFCGLPGASAAFCRLPQVSMGFHGLPWPSKGYRGLPCASTASTERRRGFAWASLAVSVRRENVLDLSSGCLTVPCRRLAGARHLPCVDRTASGRRWLGGGTWPVRGVFSSPPPLQPAQCHLSGAVRQTGELFQETSLLRLPAGEGRPLRSVGSRSYGTDSFSFSGSFRNHQGGRF